MARILSDADRPRGPAPTPIDPLRGVNEALLKLTSLVEAQLSHAPAPPTITFPEPQPHPTQLDAEIVRDKKTGKMLRVIITPIY